MHIHGRKRAAIAIVSLIALGGVLGTSVSASAGTAVASGVAVQPSGIVPSAAPSAHLTYHGGPMINNVEVTPLVWGSWNYGAETGTVNITKARVTAALNTIVNSPYIDWLTEYNAGGFHVGRGTVDPWRTLTPGAGNDGGTVTDAQIVSVLRSQIASGALPAPSNNRLYTLFFRKGQVITTPNGDSRYFFCAYHGNTMMNLQNVWFAVVPFEAQNANCQKAGYTHADNLQAALSHEVIEAVTDPAVRTQTSNGWYDDSTGYEIGDICAWRFGTINGYVVQKEWSNAAHACIVRK